MLILAGTKNQLRRRSVHDKDTHDRKKTPKKQEDIAGKTPDTSVVQSLPERPNREFGRDGDTP